VLRPARLHRRASFYLSGIGEVATLRKKSLAREEKRGAFEMTPENRTSGSIQKARESIVPKFISELPYSD
jgi:hypothetical protein